MKLIVAVVDKEREGGAIGVLEAAKVPGFSVIPSVFGKGATGAHLGNRAFPGENVMIVALVSPAEFGAVTRGFAEFAGSLRAEEGLRVIALEADSIV